MGPPGGPEDSWKIYNDSLILNFRPSIMDKFFEDADKNIKDGDERWISLWGKLEAGSLSRFECDRSYHTTCVTKYLQHGQVLSIHIVLLKLGMSMIVERILKRYHRIHHRTLQGRRTNKMESGSTLLTYMTIFYHKNLSCSRVCLLITQFVNIF